MAERQRGAIIKALGRGVKAGGRAAMAGKGNRLAALRAGAAADICGAPLTSRGVLRCEKKIRRGKKGCGMPAHEAWLGIQEPEDFES